ncbi:MAG: hypothetical protein LBL65_08255 [Campylobacteraceae bacterium]|nr:hypothetical protein [Campylobacteraceae bacterium]
MISKSDIYLVNLVEGVGDSINNYVKNANLVPKNRNVNYQAIIEAQQKPISEFYEYVTLYIQNIKKNKNYNDIIVEDLEIEGSIINILRNQAKIHTRLHCSDDISNFISERYLSTTEKQVAVNKVNYMSALPFILTFLLSNIWSVA